MFTIDLLKGQGIPMKTTPQSMAVMAVATLLPVIVAIALFGFYLRNRVLVSVQQQQIDHYKAKTAELSGVVEYQKKLENEKSVQRDCLVEVNKLVAKRLQWSDVLSVLAESIPESLVLTSLEVDERQVKKRIPDEDNPENMVDKTVSAKTLILNVRDATQTQTDSGTAAVQLLSERLYSSKILGPMLENVIPSRETTLLDDRNIISYEIKCLFKSRI